MKRFLVQIWTEIGHSGSKTITYGNEIVIKLVFYCGLIVWFFLSRISPPNMAFLSLWWQYVTYYYNFSVCWENDDFRFLLKSFGMSENVEQVLKLYWLPVKRIGSTLLWTMNTILIAIIQRKSKFRTEISHFLAQISQFLAKNRRFRSKLWKSIAQRNNNPPIISTMKV